MLSSYQALAAGQPGIAGKSGSAAMRCAAAGTFSGGKRGTGRSGKLDCESRPEHERMTDDELMTLRGTHSLVGLYANAPQRIEAISPQQVAARRIGHFGFFRDQFRQSLWPRAAAALAALGGGGMPHGEVSGTTA